MNYPALLASGAFFLLLYMYFKLERQRRLAVAAAREYNAIMKEAIPYLAAGDAPFLTPEIYARLTGIAHALNKANK